MVDERRVRSLNDRAATGGPVVYWMSRDQRVSDNWALLYAQEKAIERNVPLYVVFNLFRIEGRANTRQYNFMFAGLSEVEENLASLNIPFTVLFGTPEEVIPQFAKKHGVGEVVVDFSPLRYARERRTKVAAQLSCALTEVDAHNIIPVWQASDKEEFAAYTFRPKVHRALTQYLTDFPKVRKHPHEGSLKHSEINWDGYLKKLPLEEVGDTAFVAGEKAAKKHLQTFIASRLDTYHEDRNDPTKNGVSGLSPYLHFGQLSAQRVAYEVNQAYENNKEAREAFLEELIVRRELADNYCFYNKNYDKVAGAHAWAQKTLDEHKSDVREYIYTKEQFERAETHDDLWNAMQLQMVSEGKMHGWCRMYWAKKILEWTPDVQTAIDMGLYLNDKYELDGMDPNGVVGVMWSMCGVHDRAWNERTVFGKIRFMNYAGAKRKFDIKAYIERYGRKESLFE
ncbi:MAG: Deoxyribodipyrimidine photolyase [Candidatus Parcubacteria bacterium]|jgi:deoxyribodipyrimidine photo-lyase